MGLQTPKKIRIDHITLRAEAMKLASVKVPTLWMRISWDTCGLNRVTPWFWLDAWKRKIYHKYFLKKYELSYFPDKIIIQGTWAACGLWAEDATCSLFISCNVWEVSQFNVWEVRQLMFKPSLPDLRGHSGYPPCLQLCHLCDIIEKYRDKEGTSHGQSNDPPPLLRLHTLNTVHPGNRTSVSLLQKDNMV